MRKFTRNEVTDYWKNMAIESKKNVLLKLKLIDQNCADHYENFDDCINILPVYSFVCNILLQIEYMSEPDPHQEFTVFQCAIKSFEEISKKINLDNPINCFIIAYQEGFKKFLTEYVEKKRSINP